jgi:hypothetical protein
VKTPVSTGHITQEGYKISNIICGNGFSIIVESPNIKLQNYQKLQVEGDIAHAKEITVLTDEHERI